ncbi:MAG: IS1/IS6 family transposase [Acidobacteria bacterium]|nr:IS1/IS6 family transposase [Acidobacteriota bacterium]
MTCRKCEHGTAKRFGFTKARSPRYRCRACGATFTEAKQNPLGDHTTSVADACRVFTLLTEGMSVRAVSRVTGIHKTTILSLLNTVGEKCARLFDAKVQNVKPRFVQADEIWTFVQKKQKRLTMKDNPAERGDQYVWIALDSETKAVLSYYIGKRDAVSAYEFIGDLSRRIAEQHRPQLTTDGLEGYIPAVEEHFGADVDFAQLVKQYAQPRTDGPDWFRPSSHVTAAIPTPIMGNPKMERISTSHIERANLSVRMHLRRFTRLTNGFSKKLENLKAAVAVFMAWYNFCRVHQTLRVTPAMEAGITDHVWTIGELLSA